jgi:hypothetical protein
VYLYGVLSHCPWSSGRLTWKGRSLSCLRFLVLHSSYSVGLSEAAGHHLGARHHYERRSSGLTAGGAGQGCADVCDEAWYPAVCQIQIGGNDNLNGEVRRVVRWGRAAESSRLGFRLGTSITCISACGKWRC